MKKIDHQLTRKKNAPVKKIRKLKEPITIRLDPGIVRYFKNTGKGWQTRINEVLANHVADAG